MIAGCTGSAPTAPTEPAVPQFAITFVVANPANLSLSEPLPCPGDWSTCARGPQPQGAATTAGVTIRNYSLSAGTYRLTGVLQPSTSAGASVDIRIGAGATSTRGGVAREGPQLGFVAFTGDPPPRSSVVSQACGATFTNPYGALEWSITFRVVSTPSPSDGLCP
jgi:hypothetical protein